jgi:replication fork protection complex subunit Tof1/Swi1
MDEDALYQNHLLSVCNALGGYEGDSYEPGDEAMDCLRDLKRFLRLDEEQKDRSTHNLLGKWKVAQTDLIPLLISSTKSEDFKLGMACVEVLVPLTWPLERKLTQNEKEILMMYKSSFVVYLLTSAEGWNLVGCILVNIVFVCNSLFSTS